MNPFRLSRLALVAALSAATVVSAQTPAPSPATPLPTPPTPSALVSHPSPFLGSVPSGEATQTELSLSLADALDRGLHANLGLVNTDLDRRSASALRIRALSDLLPQISGNAFHQTAKISLITFGLTLPGFPLLIGPFSYQEGGFSLNESLFSLQNLRTYRAAQENEKAAGLSYEDARSTVVLAVGGAYFQVVASMARVETAVAQTKASRALDEEAADRLKSGLSPSIDALRATVQRRTDEQRLTVAQAALEKDKLTLARIIGLPLDQKFTPATAATYAPWTGPDQAASVGIALKERRDLRSAEAQLHSAELERGAAVASRYPTLNVSGTLDWAGKTFGTTDEIYSVMAGISMPIFTGGRIRAQVAQADAVLDRRRAELADLKARVDYDVRNAFLDLQATDNSVQVARETVDLADRALTQARDRFSNGVTNDLEVVVAEEQVAAAHENYIASLFAHSLAKLQVLHAIGETEQGVRQYLEPAAAPTAQPSTPQQQGGMN
jgi:outer membrane protein TolC